MITHIFAGALGALSISMPLKWAGIETPWPPAIYLAVLGGFFGGCVLDSYKLMQMGESPKKDGP